MRTARKITNLILAITVTAAALGNANTVQAAVGAAQICEPGGTCTVGEFLYDDEYSPITTASCTLTTRYPDDTLLHNGQAMTSSTDGWYSYEFTTPTTNGIYRAQICCTSGTDYLCLDKSFEAKPRPGQDGDIANAVWSYSDRTLSSFGTLVRDVWLNSTRSITSIFSGTDTSATVDVSDIESTVNENRLLLEELVNKPIIETFLEEEEETFDLGEKLNQTRAVANQMFVNSQYVISRSSLIASRWSRLSSRDIANNLDEVLNLLGEESDSATQETIFGQIKWMKEQWGFEVVAEILANAKASRNSLVSAQRQLVSYGKSSLALKDIKGSGTYNNRLEVLIGDVSDSTRSQTLFGKVNEVYALADTLNKYQSEAESILASWETYKKSDKQRRARDFARMVASINRVPRISRTILSTNISEKSDDKDLKNKILAGAGVLQANKQLLAKKAGKALSSTWLEVGSIVFKSIVTNPSILIDQMVPLKYYLPPEVREEDILEVEDGLNLEYDAERDQYYVKGDFELEAGETQTFSVKVQDIWVVTEDEVESMRTQAAELFRPLEKTSFFAQGVTLKSDIDVSLDKIISLQKTAVTPEQKIRSHREALIELEAAKLKIDKLEDLVTQSGNAGSLFGFVGGAQAIAVWGLIIIMSAGFVFLALYMKTLRDQEKGKKAKPAKAYAKVKKTPISKTRNLPFARLHVVLISVGVGLFSAVLSSLITRSVIKTTANVNPREQIVVQPTEEKVVLGDKSKSDQIDLESAEAMGGEDIVMVEVPEGSRVNVRAKPSLDSEIITRFKISQEVVRIDETTNWVMIVYEEGGSLESITEGWIHSDFVIDASTEDLDDLMVELEEEQL